MVEKLPLVVWPKALAQNKTRVKGYLAIEKLPRLLQLCPASRAPIEAVLDFEFNSAYGCVSLKMKIGAILVLECQRCLSPMQWKTRLKNQLCMVNSDVQACRVPKNEDYYICPSDKVPLADLIEDELLLTLPQNPMHDDKNECDTEFIGYLSRYRHQTKENPFRMLKKL